MDNDANGLTHADPDIGNANEGPKLNPKSIPFKPHDIENAINSRLLGKPGPVRLALTCLLAHGHLLIDDVPGVGKTTLARAIAEVFDMAFSRIQFTSDMLPSDILGVSIFDRQNAVFEFRPGPVFTQLLLADEINRASPRTQSALLESMAENQITVEGQTRVMNSAFTVIASQNGLDQSGTSPLPESQLDRFLMRISLGYPDRDAEKSLLAEARSDSGPLDALAREADLARWRENVRNVHVSDSLADYLLALVEASRTAPEFMQGLSPRAGLAIQRAAQAWAFLDGRDFVEPEDVQAVLPAVVDHRLIFRNAGDEPPSTFLRQQVNLA